MHVDRREGKKQGSLTSFLKKNLIWGNGPFWAQKMVHPHNSGLTLRIFLKFCRLKGANRYMKVPFVVFLEKISFGAI